MTLGAYNYTDLPSSNGVVQLILGPMFSGKSTELLRRVRRFKYARKSVFLIKYKKDTRYAENAIATHDKDTIEAHPVSTLEECKDEWEKYDVIAIDEGQFFSDLVKYIDIYARAGKTVCIAALNGTFERKPFPVISDAISIADEIHHLTAVCAGCGSPAAFSKRLSEETEVEVIGSEDKYLPMCRLCFLCPERALRRMKNVTSDQSEMPSEPHSFDPKRKLFDGKTKENKVIVTLDDGNNTDVLTLSSNLKQSTLIQDDDASLNPAGTDLSFTNDVTPMKPLKNIRNTMMSPDTTSGDPASAAPTPTTNLH